MGKLRERRKADFDQCKQSDNGDDDVVVVSLAEVFVTDAVVAKLLARDGAQIERHRVIAAKQAGIGMIEAKLVGC